MFVNLLNVISGKVGSFCVNSGFNIWSITLLPPRRLRHVLFHTPPPFQPITLNPDFIVCNCLRKLVYVWAGRGKCAQQLSYGFNILNKLEKFTQEN